MKIKTIIVILYFLCCIVSSFGDIPAIDQVGPAAMPQQIAPIHAPFYMPSFVRPTFADRVISIADFGARPEEDFSCRRSINKAIDSCSKKGGGTVVVPAGTWHTGRIELMSNVNLHLDKDARLVFSGELEDYLPVVFCRNEGVEMYGTGALIYAYNQNNIAITGSGKIVGPPLDAPLRKLKKMQVIDKEIDAYSPVESRVFDGQAGRPHLLPYTISPVSCKDVFIESVSIERSAMWNIVPIYCENVVIRGVSIDSQGIPRGDGINIESSRNVLVEYCCVNTGDDSYCLKAGRNEDGVRVRRPVENVVHRYNLSLGGHGGITCGSETAGMIRNLYVHNCRYENVGLGIRFKTRRPRGGGGENLIFDNIYVKAGRIVKWEMLGQPKYVGKLAVRLPALDLTPLTPVYRDIRISNVKGVATNSVIKCEGIPESRVESVIIENLNATAPEGIIFADAEEIILRDCTINCEGDLIFDLRNVSHLRTQNCTFTTSKPPLVRISESTSKNIDLRGVSFTNPVSDILLETTEGAAKSVVQLPVVQKKNDLFVDSLRCEYLTDPQAIDVERPRLSWAINSSKRDVHQSAYQILVASDTAGLDAGAADLWDSGKVLSDMSVQIEYDGAPLTSYKDCFWKVRVWDKNDKPSDWSNVAHWSMGIMEPDTWQAKWIRQQNVAPDDADKQQKIESIYPLPIFRKEFALEKNIKSAKVYICGLGQYELFVNGKKIGDDFLQPAWSLFEKTVYYNTYDITDQLETGGNVFGVMLGKGFYNTSGDRRIHFVDVYRPLKLILQARIVYRDGSVQTVVSDDSWKYTRGPVTHSAILGGSSYDARLFPDGWSKTNFDDGDWDNARTTTGPGGKLKAFAAPPMRVVNTYKPVTIDQPEPGRFVYDFGQNAAFVPSVTVEGKPGQTVRLTPAEQRHGQTGNANNGKGTVDQARIGKPNYCEYTLKGEGAETWSPQFYYTGFQYLQVSGAVPEGFDNPDGLPVIKELLANQVRSISETAGTFECSDKLFNDICKIIDISVQSNMSHVFTDCPHREKLGWLEQGYLMGPSVLWDYDSAAYFTKIVGDICDSQGPDGIIDTVAPNYPDFGEWDIFDYSPEWGAAGVYMPLLLYRWDGDKRILERSYPMMSGFVDYMNSSSDDLIARTGLGDWYDYEAGKGPGYSHFTPDELVSTATFYGCCDTVSKIAALVGNDTDAQKYASLSVRIKDKFNGEFFDGDSVYRNRGSCQTANSMALVLGLVPEGREQAVLDSIISDLENRGYQHTSGDVGFYYLVEALSRYGRSDVLYNMARRDTIGSYGYFVKQGWTSLPEAWDASLNSSMNHCMLGHIRQWFQQYICGIRPDPDAAGFQRCVISPVVVGDITWCRGSHRSLYGTVESSWKIDGGRFILDVTIPANTSATVCIPTKDNTQVTEGKLPANQSKGVSFVRMQNGKAVYKVQSGSYTFMAKYSSD